MTESISVVIPAFREAGRVGETVRAALAALGSSGCDHFEVLVVDDGSPDATGAEAGAAGARVIRLQRNRGKGEALTTGFQAARGDLLVMIDADLEESAREISALLAPLATGEADVAIATFPPNRGGGFGLVRRLARWAVERAGGSLRAPLSGQRALTRQAWRRIGRLDSGFGLETGMNLDALRLGLRIVEVPTTMTHRITGRTWSGFRHRGRQFRDVALAVARRWPLPYPPDPQPAERSTAPGPGERPVRG